MEEGTLNYKIRGYIFLSGNPGLTGKAKSEFNSLLAGWQNPVLYIMEIKKYDKIYQLGHEDNAEIFINPENEVCVQEKLDGANFRVYIKDGKVIFGSRTQQLTSDEGEDTNVEKNFKRAVEFVRNKLSQHNLSLFEGLTLFMECMVKHTINYNWDITPPVVGFDIYLEVLDGTSYYLHWDVAKGIFEELGFDFVPIVKVCKVSELTLPITDEQVPVSKYTSMQAEGIVFKTFNPRIYGKCVRQEFKEKNKEVFGGGKKLAKTDDEYFTALYCTNYRIEKNILKLIDDGMKLDRPMMSKLVDRVFLDIWEENYKEIIYTKEKAVNFGKFKQYVAKRCLNVLDQMITNNVISNMPS